MVLQAPLQPQQQLQEPQRQYPQSRPWPQGLLSDTVSLAPPSPINQAYTQEIGNSQTVPGPYSRALFARGDGGEPLVPISQYGIAGTSYYAITDGSNTPYDKPLAGALPTVYVRRSVARHLQEANAFLRPFGYELYVRDGWRSPVTQHAIFVTFMQQYQAAHPGASDAEAKAHALLYASDPQFSANDPFSVPLHATGGAVDVTLMPLGSGHPLNLGTGFDNTTDRAHTAYFEDHPPRNAEEAEDALLRRLLNAAMLKAGFTNYPKEWWHFDFGDRMYGSYLDTLKTNAPANVPGYSYIQPSGTAAAAA